MPKRRSSSESEAVKSDIGLPATITTIDDAYMQGMADGESVALHSFYEWWRDILADHEGHKLLVLAPFEGDDELTSAPAAVICETDDDSGAIEPPGFVSP